MALRTGASDHHFKSWLPQGPVQETIKLYRGRKGQGGEEKEKKLKFPTQKEHTQQNSAVFDKKKQLGVEFIPSEIKITEQIKNDFKISVFMVLKR